MKSDAVSRAFHEPKGWDARPEIAKQLYMVHVSPFNHELGFLLCFVLFIEYLIEDRKAKKVDI